MSYGSPSDPVGGTVITVAYAVANLLDPIRWLRLLTGNADPPGSAFVVVSTSTTGTTWMRVPTDAIADGAITTAKVGNGQITAPKLAGGAAVTNIGYTPVNAAGDAMSNKLTIARDTGANQVFQALELQNTNSSNSGTSIRFSAPSGAT